MQPDKIKLMTQQQVAALGPSKLAALADVCAEWGPISDADKARAISSLEPLDVSRLMTQRRVEVIGNYWVYIPPATGRVVAETRLAELKERSIKDVSIVDSGPQRLAISLGVFHTEAAAQARLAALEDQGVTTAKVGPRAQSVQQTALVIRDPPAPAVSRLKELQASFPGTELKIGACEKTS